MKELLAQLGELRTAIHGSLALGSEVTRLFSMYNIPNKLKHDGMMLQLKGASMKLDKIMKELERAK